MSWDTLHFEPLSSDTQEVIDVLIELLRGWDPNEILSPNDPTAIVQPIREATARITETSLLRVNECLQEHTPAILYRAGCRDVAYPQEWDLFHLLAAGGLVDPTAIDFSVSAHIDQDEIRRSLPTGDWRLIEDQSRYFLKSWRPEPAAVSAFRHDQLFHSVEFSEGIDSRQSVSPDSSAGESPNSGSVSTDAAGPTSQSGSTDAGQEQSESDASETQQSDDRRVPPRTESHSYRRVPRLDLDRDGGILLFGDEGSLFEPAIDLTLWVQEPGDGEWTSQTGREVGKLTSDLSTLALPRPSQEPWSRNPQHLQRDYNRLSRRRQKIVDGFAAVIGAGEHVDRDPRELLRVVQKLTAETYSLVLTVALENQEAIAQRAGMEGVSGGVLVGNETQTDAPDWDELAIDRMSPPDWDELVVG